MHTPNPSQSSRIQLITVIALCTSSATAQDMARDRLSQLPRTDDHVMLEIALPTDHASPWSFDAIIGQSNQRIILYPHNLRAPGFRVHRADRTGRRTVTPASPATYRGQISGITSSTVGGIEPSPTRSAQLNEYDTMRTIMLTADSPTTISYWTNHRGVESGKRLCVEYFDSNAFQWRILQDIISDGVSDSTFDHHEHELPADGYGDFLMVRFTPWGPFIGFSDKWYVDDVLIDAAGAPGDCDGDGDLDLFDYACFTSCVSAPNDEAPPECSPVDFDADNDVDLIDFASLQTALAG